MGPGGTSTALAQQGSPTHPHPSTPLLLSVTWTLQLGWGQLTALPAEGALDLPQYTPPASGGPSGLTKTLGGHPPQPHLPVTQGSLAPIHPPCPTSPGRGQSNPIPSTGIYQIPPFSLQNLISSFGPATVYRAFYRRCEAISLPGPSRKPRFPPHPMGEEVGKGPARTTEPWVQALPPPSSSFQASPCPSAQ